MCFPFSCKDATKFISTGHLSRQRPLWTEPEGLICLTLWRGCWQKLRIKAWWHHAFLHTDETRFPGNWYGPGVWDGMWGIGNQWRKWRCSFFWMRAKLKIVPRVVNYTWRWFESSTVIMWCLNVNMCCCQSVLIRKAHTSHICSLIPVKQYHFILRKLLCLICFQSSWQLWTFTEESFGPWLAKSVRGWLATWCRRACLDPRGLSMDRGLCRGRDFGREGNQGNHRNMIVWKRGEVNLKLHRDSWWIAIFRVWEDVVAAFWIFWRMKKIPGSFTQFPWKARREAFDGYFGYLVSQSCKPTKHVCYNISTQSVNTQDVVAAWSQCGNVGLTCGPWCPCVFSITWAE